MSTITSAAPRLPLTVAAARAAFWCGAVACGLASHGRVSPTLALGSVALLAGLATLWSP